MSDVGERSLGGVLFYHLARIYPTSTSAKRTFEALMAEGGRQKGKLDLGVYRCAKVGEPAEARVLAIVSLKRKGIEWAAKVMGGEPYDGLTPAEIDSLMQRRVRVVAPIYRDGLRPEGGQVRIRRPEGRPATMKPGGFLEEPVGRDE